MHISIMPCVGTKRSDRDKLPSKRQQQVDVSLKRGTRFTNLVQIITTPKRGSLRKDTHTHPSDVEKKQMATNILIERWSCGPTLDSTDQAFEPSRSSREPISIDTSHSISPETTTESFGCEPPMWFSHRKPWRCNAPKTGSLELPFGKHQEESKSDAFGQGRHFVEWSPWQRSKGPSILISPPRETHSV